ncbi:MAG: tetratricopeptide repeat protein [Chitinophagaceae bacterium]|nr:tetratricopeptide repeat protein [Chitinophagaceae bacterium]
MKVIPFILFLCLPLYSDAMEEAQKLRVSGKTMEAINLLKSKQGSLEGEKFLAKLYLDKGMCNEALQVYGKICHPMNSHDCVNEKGISQTCLGQYEAAVVSFQKAISIQENSATAYSNLAQVYFLMEDLEKAEETHLKALEISPYGTISRINYGVFLVKTKKYSQAKEVFYSVLAENKSLFYAELYLGVAHYMKNEYNSALIHLNRGIALNPEYYDLYYYRALVYYKKGDYGNSLKDLKMVDKLFPDNEKSTALRNIIKKNIKI